MVLAFKGKVEKKVNRKIQGVPQSQTTANPRHKEDEGKKQCVQNKQMHEKHRPALFPRRGNHNAKRTEKKKLEQRARQEHEMPRSKNHKNHILCYKVVYCWHKVQHIRITSNLTIALYIVSYWRKNVHKVLVNCLGGLPRNSVVRLTDRAQNDLKCFEGP